MIQPMLEELLESKGAEVREKVAFALGGLEDARSIVLLTKALNDRDAQVRKAAKTSLKDLGETC